MSTIITKSTIKSANNAFRFVESRSCYLNIYFKFFISFFTVLLLNYQQLFKIFIYESPKFVNTFQSFTDIKLIVL